MNEVIQKTIQIEENKEYVFRNQVDFCIGTGRMGLALTKEIIKFHGGNIKTYNRGGAVFETILPGRKGDKQ